MKEYETSLRNGSLHLPLEQGVEGQSRVCAELAGTMRTPIYRKCLVFFLNRIWTYRKRTFYVAVLICLKI